MAMATTGDEYKLLHQTSFLIKAARIFSLIWILAVIVPALYGIAKYGENIKDSPLSKRSARQITFLPTSMTHLRTKC